MNKLYSYCIPHDNGAAPNPFWGICTLNICKPVIRRSAQIGDWIVATGSSEYSFENKVVYAMEITEKLTMEQYDRYCKTELPDKIPRFKTQDYRRRVGDCIYDFDYNPAKLLNSVHNEGNRERDLGGKYTLLSNHFYYFGSKPVILPKNLLSIVRQGQGHKSTSNSPYLELFIDWIMSQTQAKNKVYSDPYNRETFDISENTLVQCAARDCKQDDLDEMAHCD